MRNVIIKKLILIFAISFLLNWAWENLHSNLYIHYQSGAITQLILLRATLFDAVFITLAGIMFIKFTYFQKRQRYLLLFGFVAAVLIEIYALGSNRWGYNELMPIIPWFNTGLTPSIQLGLLGYITYKLANIRRFYRRA